MQYSIRGLFGLVTAAALLVGFAGLPSDFKKFLALFSFLFAGVFGCFYAASERDVREPYVAAFVIVWTAAVVAAILTSPFVPPFGY